MNNLKPGRNIPNGVWDWGYCSDFMERKEQTKSVSIRQGKCGRVRAVLMGRRRAGPARCFITGDPVPH